MPAPATTMSGQTLRIVRFAMLTMLLGFVCFIWFVQRNAGGGGGGAPNLAALRWVGFGLSAAAVAALVVLRGVRPRAPMEARGTCGLIGSAFGEAAALFGAIYYLLGGGLAVFAIGLLVFLLSWGILPADPEAL
ncbi:MAG TPA: hypothetical protein VGB15_23840 [Longimicrobium sp.]